MSSAGCIAANVSSPIRAAASASSPMVARLPDGCESTPFSTRISAAGTCHASAAAATSMALAKAPALR